MILELKNNVSKEEAAQLALSLKAFMIQDYEKTVLITGSSLKEVPENIQSKVNASWAFNNDIQLASKKYKAEKRLVKIGNVTIGGQTNNTLIIGGPCSVESEEQIR